MRIYLAGPMRGYPDNNAAAFRAAAAQKRAEACIVWSPYENDESAAIAGGDLRRVFKRDLNALLEQDAVIVLPGWSRSEGARLEVHAANVAGIPVFDEGWVEIPPFHWSCTRL